MKSINYSRKNMRLLKKHVWTMMLLALIAGSISCSEETPTGLQEDKNAPVVRVNNVAENDTLYIEYDDSGTLLEVEFFDETQLSSYSIEIGSESGSLISMSQEIEGTQVLDFVDISALQNNTPYVANLSVEDASGNSSILSFFLVIQFQEPVEVIFENLYIIGSAAPGGWSLDQQTPLTANQNNPNIFSWSGELKAGEFKFKAYEENDFCGGDWLHPTEASADISSTEYVILEGCADTNPDHKWELTEEEAGTYSITIDLENETINIEKQ